MSTPAISIIMPVYNTEKYLVETIKSVRNQSFRNFEIICVDDGSTDNTVRILENIAQKDHRFTILHQKNAGAGAARNHGFSHAKGKYVIFLDSDDLFSPKLLEKLYDAAEAANADISTCNFVKFGDFVGLDYCVGIHTEWLPQGIQVFSYKDCPSHIMSVVNPTPWNKLYRSDFIRENNLKYEEISSSNDITFAAVSVATAQRVTFVPDYLVQYRVGHTGTISSGKAKNLNNVHIAISSAIRQARALPHAKYIRDSILRFAVDNYMFALKNYIADFNDPNARDFYTTVHNVFNEPEFANMDPESVHNQNLYLDFFKVRRHDYETMNQLRNRKIIVSLTTFPKRIGTLTTVLDTIYLQTRPADRIILWLAEEQFPNKEKDLPKDLMLLVNDKRLEIRWCDDLRPHKKYFYALQEFTEELVVTIDDDLLYPADMLEKLFQSYLMYPDAVSTLRAHLILINEDNEILSYSDWVKETDACIYEPSMQLLATGGAGVLYPPKLFNPKFFDKEAIKETCLCADDLWLKAMQTVSEVPVVVARHYEHLHYLPDSQDDGLVRTNVDQNQNDVQFEKILNWLDQNFEPGIFLKNLTTLDIGIRIIGMRALVEHFDKERRIAKAQLRRARIYDNPVYTEYISQMANLGSSLKTLRASGHHMSQLWRGYTVLFFAWLPLKYLSFLQCVLDHGMSYTIRYAFTKLGRKLFRK